MNNESKKNETTTKNELVQLNQAQIAQLLAASLVGCLFIFMAGFYFGKQSAVEPFIEQVMTDSFADKVSNAFSSLYDVEDEEETESKEETAQDGVLDSAAEASVESSFQQEENDAQANSLQLYVAQIAGFGTKRAAERCIENLKNNGFAVTLKSRKSTTSKGKEIIWYQVVTEPIEDKEQLHKLVDQIRKIAKVKDVPIVMVEKAK